MKQFVEKALNAADAVGKYIEGTIGTAPTPPRFAAYGGGIAAIMAARAAEIEAAMQTPSVSEEGLNSIPELGSTPEAGPSESL